MAAECSSSRPDLSLERVHAFLDKRLEREVKSVEPIARQGEWSSAFMFQDATRSYVVRFSTFAEDFEKDRLAARYRSDALPVPRVIEIGEAFDGYFAISERMPGAYLDELDEEGMRAVLPSLFATVDAMRLVDVSGTSGFGVWGADGHASYESWPAALLAVAEERSRSGEPGWRSRIGGWREQLDAWPAFAARFDDAVRELEALTAYLPGTRHLVHSDLLNYNVLVEGDRVSAVLDWGSSLYGDWLYDIAWLCYWGPWYAQWRAIDFRAEARRHFETTDPDAAYFDERLRCYGLHIGLDNQVYSVFRGRRDFLDRVSRYTLEFGRG